MTKGNKVKVISLMSQKGGSGKTTLAIHLAVCAMEHGEKVGIIDTDMQQSSTYWGQIREGKEPVVATADAGVCADIIDTASSEGFTYLVIDTAPHAAPEAAIIARLSDLIVMPCRPSVIDITAASRTADIARAARRKGLFVLNGVTKRTREIDEATDYLKKLKFEISNTSITNRLSLSRALSTGKSVTEFEEDGKASEEIISLWLEIKEMIDG